MISLSLSKELKKAGLRWNPALHDFFAIPERGLDDRVFVISDLLTNIENVFGSKVVAFQGASEWALDYLVTSEAIWVPSETQLRQMVEERLLRDKGSYLNLAWSMNTYRCEIFYAGQSLSFEDSDACNAYAKALLYVLEDNPSENNNNYPI